MRGVRIRLTKDVQGVGVRGLHTTVSPDLAEVLFKQGRAEPRSQSAAEKPPTVPPPAPKIATKQPGNEPPKPDVPLTVKELRLKLEKLQVQVPADADRKTLAKLFLEATKKGK